MNRGGVPKQAIVRPISGPREFDAAGAHADFRLAMRKLLLISLLLLPLALRADAQKVPPEKELKTMARDSLLAFNEAVQEKNFAGFHKHELATLFRDQMPLEKFTTVFKEFLEKGYDISNIAKTEPVFDEPAKIDGNGVLAVSGSYPTKPNKVIFKLKYLQEKSAWKLVGINVQVLPFVEKTGPVPTEKEAKRLALDSLLAFNKALQAKSFDSFHRHIAKLWQAQTTPEKLKEIFQPFLDQDAHISAITDVEPVFDSKPAIDGDGFLILKGSYPTQPSKVFFELKYVYEEDIWELVGINVNLKKSAGTDKGLKKPGSDDEDEKKKD
jgi:hypothetical protein